MKNWLKALPRRLLAFVVASLGGYLLAAAFSTQSVLSSLADMGVTVTLGQRIAATAHDIAGMTGIFLPILAVGFLLAFLVTGLLMRWLDRWRTPLYVLAGGVAVLTVLLSLKASFGLMPIAGARTAAGLASQCVAGAIAGYLFALISPRVTRGSIKHAVAVSFA